MEISFYHMTKSPLEKSLPKLLEKVYGAGLRAVVISDTQERIDRLNALLWTYSSAAFLPHGTAKEGFPEDQPIWLTTESENPNNSSILVVTHGQRVKTEDSFKRVLDLFDGNDETQLKSARQRWKDYQQQGHALTYWQQDEQGSWIKKS